MLNIDYKVGGGIAARNMAREAIVAGLFVENWSMILMLIRCVSSVAFKRYAKRSYYLLALAYAGNKPIGVCCIEKDVIGIYVRSRYRRKGIGKDLIDALNDIYDIKETVTAGEGITGSITFFKRIGIDKVEKR